MIWINSSRITTGNVFHEGAASLAWKLVKCNGTRCNGNDLIDRINCCFERSIHHFQAFQAEALFQDALVLPVDFLDAGMILSDTIYRQWGMNVSLRWSYPLGSISSNIYSFSSLKFFEYCWHKIFERERPRDAFEILWTFEWRGVHEMHLDNGTGSHKILEHIDI